MSEISLAIAFLAGLLSFVSPCVLALVPVYLAFLGESAGGSATAGGALAVRRPLLIEALLFVGGFGVVFVLLGTSVGLLGSALFRVPLIRELAGIAIIGLGLVTTGLFGPVIDRLRLPIVLLPSIRAARATSLGALVAIGWVPCIGPVLGAILTMGASSQDVLAATLLLVGYTAGLAVPFLTAAVALPAVRPLFDVLRRRQREVRVVSGIFIMTVGVLILTNAFARLSGLFTWFL